MTSIRMGVVGVGHMGSYHVAALSELMDVDVGLVAVADQDFGRAREIADRYGAEAFPHASGLIGKVDAVVIAVPTPDHHPVSRMFLNAGLHVLVEKPISNQLDKARDLFEVARKNSLVLHVGHVERFNGAVQEMVQIVQEPLLIECRRLGPFAARIREDGVVLDVMIHDLDIVLRMVEEEIVSISAVGGPVLSDRDDVAIVQLRFSGGCVANLTASRVTQSKIRTMAISQLDSYIFLDYADQELRIHRQASSEHYLTREELKYREQTQVERVFVHKDENPLKLELRHFIQNIRSGQIIEDVERELRSLDVALHVLELLNVPAPVSN
ncbi:MAG: Gfo/Idh/MocA family oxidoreductase [bacterium]|nr:Gfo/Idh/MocA family oxidoreductase [bacterium]